MDGAQSNLGNNVMTSNQTPPRSKEVFTVTQLAEIRAILVNMCHDVARLMYRVSECSADDKTPIPTVVVMTSAVIARYLNATGDLRTLGGEFDVRVVTIYDYRVAGKIFLTFDVFDEGHNTVSNPCFLHFVNCPLLGTVEVDNISDVLKKQLLNSEYGNE